MSKAAKTILQMSRAVISREGSLLTFQFNSAGEAQSALTNFMGSIGHAHHEAKASDTASDGKQAERATA